jgi:hypothetical protein
VTNNFIGLYYGLAAHNLKIRRILVQGAATYQH